MSILQAIRDWFKPKQASRFEGNINDPRWWESWGGSAYTNSGEPVTQGTAETFAAVWAATRAISETVAGMPLKLYQWRVVNGQLTKQFLPDHPIQRLLNQPNPDMDGFTFWDMQSKRLVNEGNAYAEIEWNGSTPVALWPIRNHRVQLAKTVRRARGEPIVYWISASDSTIDANWESKILVAGEDMFNTVGPFSDNGIYAYGVIRHAANSIGLGLATDRYGSNFFAKGGRPSGMLTHPGQPDVNARANIRREFNEHHAQGAGSGNEILLTWEGMTYTAFSLSPEESQFLATRTFNVEEIARWYGLAPAIVQHWKDSKFQTVEAQMRHFLKLGIRPWIERWERSIKKQIIGEDNPMYAEFDMDSLIRGDVNARAEANRIALTHGWKNQDEIRAEEGRNPLPNGDGETYWMPLNVAPIDKVRDGTASGPDGGMGGRDNEPNEIVSESE